MRDGGGLGDLLQEGRKHASLGQGPTWEDVADSHSSHGVYPSPVCLQLQAALTSLELPPCTERQTSFLPENW